MKPQPKIDLVYQAPVENGVALLISITYPDLEPGELYVEPDPRPELPVKVYEYNGSPTRPDFCVAEFTGGASYSALELAEEFVLHHNLYLEWDTEDEAEVDEPEPTDKWDDYDLHTWGYGDKFGEFRWDW